MSVEPSLVGRTADLEAVSSALIAAASGAGPNTVVVSGMGGAGTSAVIRRAADLLSDRFPDGRLVLDVTAMPAQLRDRMPAGHGMLSWALHELGLRGGDVPQSAAGRSAAYRNLLAARRMLVLVDNASRADQFAALAPFGSVSASLVAVRTRTLRVPNSIRVEVEPLPVPDGLALIGTLTGPERVEKESVSATQLVALCGGLPLALRTAGKRLAGCPQVPISLLTDAMSDDGRRLDLLEFDGLSMRASLGRSVSGLAAESRRALQALGASPEAGLTARALASRTGTPVTQVWQALEELAEARLATSLRAGRYVPANELIRLYATELAAN